MSAVRLAALAVMVAVAAVLLDAGLLLASDSGDDRYRQASGVRHGALSVGQNEGLQQNAPADDRGAARNLRFGQGYEYRMSVQPKFGSLDAGRPGSGRR